MGANPSATNVGDNLSSQAVLFDSSFVPPMMSNTAAFLVAQDRRMQPLNSGINRTLFSYELLTDAIAATSDGVIGSPEFFAQIVQPAQIGENAAFANFSAFSVASSIDPDQVESTAKLLSYQTGITVSEQASSTLDDLSNIDSNVNQSSLISSPSTTSLAISDLRTMKNQLFTLGALPIRNGLYKGQMHPMILNDVSNETTVNNSITDFWKYTAQSQEKYNEVAGTTNQWQALEIGPGLGVEFHITPFVTSTANFQSSGKTAYRSYMEAQFGLIGIWLGVPGDTEIGEADWKTIDCNVVTNAAPSAWDPVGQIPAWTSVRWHNVFTNPPGTGVNSQRVRYIDAIPLTT
jgi:hypothetical protein